MEEMGWKRAYLVSTEGGDYGELGRAVREVRIKTFNVQSDWKINSIYLIF